MFRAHYLHFYIRWSYQIVHPLLDTNRQCCAQFSLNIICSGRWTRLFSGTQLTSEPGAGLKGLNKLPLQKSVVKYVQTYVHTTKTIPICAWSCTHLYVQFSMQVLNTHTHTHTHTHTPHTHTHMCTHAHALTCTHTCCEVKVYVVK